MDKIKDIILKIEQLKTEQKFEQSTKILEEAIIKYSSDYRLYEELSDVNLNKESATGNYLKWFLLLSQDKIIQAIKYLEKSNKLLSNNSEVLRNLGWAYTMIWDTYKGISILQRALNINPNDELITEDLAMALIWSWKINEWNNLLQKIWKEIVS